MSDFGKLGVRLFLSVMLIATIGFGLTAFFLVRMESKRNLAKEQMLNAQIEVLVKRNGVHITLSPEIKNTAVLGSIKQIELVFKPEDIVAAMNAYNDTLPKVLTITQSK